MLLKLQNQSNLKLKSIEHIQSHSGLFIVWMAWFVMFLSLCQCILVCMYIQNPSIVWFSLEFSINSSIQTFLSFCFLVSFVMSYLLIFWPFAQFALPHIMGWDRLTAQLPGGIVGGPSKVNPQMPDLEWDKWSHAWPAEFVCSILG